YTYQQGGPTANEVQEVELNDATGGTFTLTFDGQTTAALDWDASSSEVESALEALSNIDAVSVSGSAGGPFSVTFEGSLAGTNVPLLVADATSLANDSLKKVIAYEYDAAGQLLEASDDAATYGYVYDDLGRLKTETQDLSGAGLDPLVTL